MFVYSFSPCALHRYMSGVHEALLQLDYGAALFCGAYLVAVLRRTLRESVPLYVGFIIVKTAPHVPLVLGWRSWHLRSALLCTSVLHCISNGSALHCVSSGRGIDSFTWLVC